MRPWIRCIVLEKVAHNIYKLADMNGKVVGNFSAKELKKFIG